METLTLYAHPFSSYCQKALMALYENETPFALRMLDRSDPAVGAEFARLWPLRKFPILVDGNEMVAEASIIIEHLDIHHPGPVRFLPDDRAESLQVRFLDRFFDNYIHTPMQAIVADAAREEAEHDPKGVAEAHALLGRAYEWLDVHMAGRPSAAGATVTLADCAAAPALFYADWACPIPAALANLRGYRARLNAHPSFARCIEDARRFRPLFPPGAPDRD